MIFFLLAALAAGDGVTERIDLDQLTKRYDGRRILVEGVFSHLGRHGENEATQMQLRHCTAMFLVPRKLLLTQSPEGSLEIVGVVRAERKQLIVEVESFAKIPSETDRYERKAAVLGADDAKGWQELSEWAERRYKMYGDQAMAAHSLQAYKNGVEAQRRAAEGDPALLSGLKAKILRDDRWKSFDAESLDHEILHAEFAKIPPEDLGKVRAFADALKARLPGAAQTGTLDVRLRSRYDRKPLVVYAESDQDYRRLFARYWYVTLIGLQLKLMRATEDKAPYDLGRLAKELAPDYPEEARKWFAEYAKAQEARVGEMDADSLAAVAKIINAELSDFAHADKLRMDWLATHEDQLRKADQEAAENAKERRAVARREAEPWFELAMKELEWFPKDAAVKERAAAILSDIYRFAPEFNKAEIELRKLNYALDEKGRWLPREKIEVVRNGRNRRPLAVDMSAGEVLAELGEPTQRARVGTSVGVSHQWIYRTPDETLVVVLNGPENALHVAKLHRDAAR